MLWVKQLVICSYVLQNSTGTVLFSEALPASGQSAKVTGMQHWISNCLLNAAGVLLAGRCHSMASYNACGSVVVCHLHFAAPGQEQEFHLMPHPKKRPKPVSLLGFSVYLMLASADGKSWANFSCFTIISFNYFRDWGISGGISWAEYTLKPKPENCKTRETVLMMFLLSLFIT